MHLLFIESNPVTARTLHSEFLNYRGVNWSLSHCANYQQAVDLLERDSFQSVLYSNDCPYEQTVLEIHELLRTANCPPLVAVTGNLSPHEHLNLVADGSDDCFNRSEISGAGIMRQLRMAELRKSVSTAQTAQFAEGCVPGFSVEQFLYLSECDPLQNPNGMTVSRPLRVAHVSCRSTLIDSFQFENRQHVLLRYRSLKEVLIDLDESVHKFDALIVEQSVFEQASESETMKLGTYLTVVPGIVLTMEKSDFSALSYLERGYCDCLIADDISTNSLFWAIHKAVVRRRRALLNSLAKQQVGPNVNDRRSDLRDSINRRRHVRFHVNKPIIAIPILPSGAPDLSAQCDAMATIVSLGGLGVTIPHRTHLPRRNWIIGIQQDNGSTGYISGYLRNVTYAEGEIRGGLVFQNETGDFFRRSNLWPELDSATCRLATQIGESRLDEWVKLGVLKKRLSEANSNLSGMRSGVQRGNRLQSMRRL